MVRVLREGSPEAGTLNALAWFCATNGLYLDQSLEAAERAVALEPEDSNILDTLAEVYFRLGRVAEAIATEERAQALAPEDRYLREQLDRFRAAQR
jgi:tetratricopeptide (TPR) repeat protein